MLFAAHTKRLLPNPKEEGAMTDFSADRTNGLPAVRDRGCVETLFRGRLSRDFGRLADGPFRGRTRPSAGFSA
ncbi:hypothetical protein, partial [Sphingomonas sp. WG]|uniref:hypothetical protein n=1 Tax=Sphingomonas sp. WG TaxID=1592629 RepID=UPI001F36A5D0